MGKIRKISVSLGIAIVVYIIMQILFSYAFPSMKYETIYIPNRKIDKGSEIKGEDFLSVNIKRGELKNLNCISDISNIIGKVAVKKIEVGEISIENKIAKKDEYIHSKDSQSELVSIKLGNAEQSVSYQIFEQSTVNLYFVGKKDSILNSNIQKETTVPTGNNNINAVIKILSNVEIVGVYDKNGKEIKKGCSEGILESVVFDVSREDAMLINSLKNIGRFEISKIK